MPTLLDVLTGNRETLAEELWRKCGGPGSRRPGPCPSGVKPEPAQPTAPQQAVPGPESDQPERALPPLTKDEKAKLKRANKAAKAAINGKQWSKEIVATKTKHELEAEINKVRATYGTALAKEYGVTWATPSASAIPDNVFVASLRAMAADPYTRVLEKAWKKAPVGTYVNPWPGTFFD